MKGSGGVCGAGTAVSISSGALLDQGAAPSGERPLRRRLIWGEGPHCPPSLTTVACKRRPAPGFNLIPPPTYVKGTLPVITGRALN